MILCSLCRLDTTICVIQNIAIICATILCNLCQYMLYLLKKIMAYVEKWPPKSKAADQMRSTVGPLPDLNAPETFGFR
jgi:hypothetical protein